MANTDSNKTGFLLTHGGLRTFFLVSTARSKATWTLDNEQAKLYRTINTAHKALVALQARFGGMTDVKIVDGPFGPTPCR